MVVTHRILAAAVLLTTTVSAASSDALELCQQLHTRLPSKTVYSPGSGTANQTTTGNVSATYTEAQSRYWDKANADDVPACVLFPSTAQDVSLAMTLLNAAPSVPFALKSGGHNFNRGFSSTNGGVLISFRPNMNYTRLLPDTYSAEVGPGARWGEVMAVLDQSNRCVVGGRVADVGVGGYIPYGGLSYLSAQYGFAADNVLNFEMVLANGTIVNANKTSHPDIFFAVRGGGNLFGVVTKYTLVAHPIANVWGGARTYSADKAPQIFTAITNYVANFNETRSALIPTVVWIGGLNGTSVITIFFFWDGDQPPAHVFAEFDRIPATTSATKTQRYPELLNAIDAGDLHIRTTDAISSLPNMPAAQTTEFLAWHLSHVNRAGFLTAPGFALFNLALQPIPVALQNASHARGPAALATHPHHGDKLWIEYSLAWYDPVYDQTWPQELADHVAAARAHQQTRYAGVEPTNFVAGDLAWDPYNPLFANDAQVGQPVLRSYGNETFHRLRDLQAALDPNATFLLQTKSFHF